MHSQKQKNNYYFTVIILAVFCTVFLFSPVLAAYDQDPVSILEQEINKKKQYIKELETERELYQERITQKQKEALSLSNQLSILESRIEKAKLNIELTQSKIEEADLQIRKVEKEITDKEEKIETNKVNLGEFIRTIYKYDQKGYIEIILTNDNLSDFFNHIQYLESVQNDVQITLGEVQELRERLVVEKNNLGAKKKKLENLKEELLSEKNALAEETGMKTNLLAQTKSSERKFENLLVLARQEFEQANVEMKNLEQKIRAALEAQEQEQGGTDLDNDTATLSWPVPSRQIVAYFHDPDYPYRLWIGEHSGVDIRTLRDGVPSNGISVRAAASGYVARAKNGGATGYSYVMIIHNNGISTVYGHLSRIDVKEDSYVKRGQVMGLSGGMPGTPGAGRFSSGPHLHFEVRLNGIPVNPLNYLP
ncbi:peptidoglycan DD-metalloendopeptidase family protein [Patescibacteria group bacterium]|nr:peptidoglycan DD-metalloendopeptidase family protein [Patescibacteria group bacterium]MBU4512959.1 peptidoglycan DD-metalloendopeptidase family protein [Patescibacteria group bacterium]MCG2692995.1 peptidoglycan DD-metalloendopeptidase family protein [Candidatus Parcubacteria bacterium]